jgi:O-antigen ligase
MAADGSSQNALSRAARISFLLLVASLGAIQLPITIGDQDLRSTDFLFLLTGGFWFLALIFRKRRLNAHRFYWLLFFYLATLFFSCFSSANPSASFWRMPAEVYLVALCVLSFNLIDNEAELKHAVLAWLVGTGISLVLGLSTIAFFYISPGNSLLEFLTYHYGAVPVGNYPRITGTFVSASMFCNYLNVALLLTLLAGSAKWISKKIMWPLAAAIFICSLFTISVGLGGIFLAIAVWFWLTTKTNIAKAGSIVGILIAAAFVAMSVYSLTQFPLVPSGRLLVWKEAFQTFADNISFGHGLGLPIANVMFANSEGGFSLLTDAHNSYLSVAAQSGIFALIAIMAITVFILREWRNSTRDVDNNLASTALGLAFLCSFVHQGLTGSFEETRHLWVLIGMFLAATRIEAQKVRIP